MDVNEKVQTALKAHGKWVYRLRDVIESGSSGLSPSTVKMDNQCDFGKWLYSDFANEVKDQSSYENIKSLHAEFHLEASRILELALANKKELALKNMGSIGRFMVLSAHLTLMLQKIIKKQGNV